MIIIKQYDLLQSIHHKIIHNFIATGAFKSLFRLRFIAKYARTLKYSTTTNLNVTRYQKIELKYVFATEPNMDTLIEATAFASRLTLSY